MAGSFACEGSRSFGACRAFPSIKLAAAAAFSFSFSMSADDSTVVLEKGFPWGNWLAGIAALFLAVVIFGGGGFNGHGCGPGAERNRSIAAHAVIKSGLEQYMEEYGQYPAPVHPEATIKVSGRDMRVGAARMLYQALTGDGDSEIKLPSATGKPSDGKISEEEAEHSINGSLPKSMVAISSEGYRYLVDGWGRPFQYVKGGEGDTINPTYDLWAFGDIKSKEPLFYDAETRRKAEAIAKWIRNW
jgi:hypothetical protein